MYVYSIKGRVRSNSFITIAVGWCATRCESTMQSAMQLWHPQSQPRWLRQQLRFVSCTRDPCCV